MVAERTELAVVDGAEYNAQQRAIIKQTVAKDCTEAEFGLFIEVCKSTGLNPFARQIYAIKRGGAMTIQTGIDGYRVLAERSGKYAGQVGPFWCDADGEWKDVWLDGTPVACKIGVLRRDFAEPMWAVARTAAYQQTTNALWKTMPEVMIAKCAEALALRKAFPEHITNVYTADEMAQADNPAPLSYVEQDTAPAAPPTASAKQTLGTKLDQALKNAAITTLLVEMGLTSENEQRAHLMATFNTIRSGGGDVTSASVLASLRAQIETAQAAFPLEALETGASGN